MKKMLILLLAVGTLFGSSGCIHVTSGEIAALRREFGALLNPRFPIVPIPVGHREDLRPILAAMQKVSLEGYSIVQVDFGPPTLAHVHLGRVNGDHGHGLLFFAEKKNDDWIVTKSPLQPF
jgi:hypothetical protein